MYGSKKAAQEREAPAREKPSDPRHAALREFRLRCPEFRTRGPVPGFPPEHSGQQSRQFGESLSEHTEGGRSFVTSVKKQNTVRRVGLKQVSVSEEAERESQQEQGRWPGHQRSGGRVLKADGSIGDGFRAGTGGPEPDCPWATPLERSCSPGRTVGECARQAQSGARASCCTRSWVLRGLGSCRRLPSPQQNSVPGKQRVVWKCTTSIAPLK